MVGNPVDDDDGEEQQKEDRDHLVIAALAPLHGKLEVMANAPRTGLSSPVNASSPANS